MSQVSTFFWPHSVPMNKSIVIRMKTFMENGQHHPTIAIPETKNPGCFLEQSLE